jgi:cytochrome oxidase Cu insertion factor (SCO1/SenC/PrrC family)
MISKKIKARIFLITILLLFSAPFIASWYLVFYSDFKQGDDGVENGILISPVIELGQVEANVIGLNKKETVYGKWTISAFVGQSCDESCEDLLYKLRQLRLAIGKNLDKVDRLIFSDSDEIMKYSENYTGQKVVYEKTELSRIKLVFNSAPSFDKNNIFLIDPYGFIMMTYKRDAEPKGIIRDVERLIKNSK